MPFCKVTLKGPKPLPLGYPKRLKKLGDHIRKKRLDLRLLQRQVAEQVGVTETTIYNWENNRSTPALRHIPAIIRFLGYFPLQTPESLPEKLILARRTRGLSRKRMAKTLGVNESTLARWETRKGHPSKESLKVLKAFFQHAGI